MLKYYTILIFNNNTKKKTHKKLEHHLLCMVKHPLSKEKPDWFWSVFLKEGFPFSPYYKSVNHTH